MSCGIFPGPTVLLAVAALKNFLTQTPTVADDR